jgi:probable HAF family extracellular repeat protein
VQVYRWTAAAGYQILGSPSNSDFFGAAAVSFDGSAVTGEHPIGNASTFEAFRWTAAHGLKQLPMNIASAITADGKMVAGGDNWWMTSGQSGIFGPFPGEQDQTEAFGLAGTAENPVAVGAAIKGSGAQGATYHAFRWTPAGGLRDLGVGIGTQSYGTAISADGQVVVGETIDAFGLNRAFRWTAATGMKDLGTLGGPESAALAVSADGTVVVGTSLTDSFVCPAGIWRAHRRRLGHACGTGWYFSRWHGHVRVRAEPADQTISIRKQRALPRGPGRSISVPCWQRHHRVKRISASVSLAPDRGRGRNAA